MNEKIYKVTTHSIYFESGEILVESKIFLNKELAQNYFKREVQLAKQDENEIDKDDYCVEEDENSYERYLVGYASQDSISIWLEEDTFYDEIELNKEKKNDKDYEKDI